MLYTTEVLCNFLYALTIYLSIFNVLNVALHNLIITIFLLYSLAFIFILLKCNCFCVYSSNLSLFYFNLSNVWHDVLNLLLNKYMLWHNLHYQTSFTIVVLFYKEGGKGRRAKGFTPPKNSMENAVSKKDKNAQKTSTRVKYLTGLLPSQCGYLSLTNTAAATFCGISSF